MRIESGKGKKKKSGNGGDVGLLNYFHALVVFQRFRNRCHPRDTDVVASETARIAMNAKRKD